MKRTIRLRESELRRMISESVKRGLFENMDMAYDMPSELCNAIDTLAQAFVKATRPWYSPNYAKNVQEDFYKMIREKYQDACEISMEGQF